MVGAAGYTDCLGAGPPSPAAGTAPTWAWGWPRHLGQWVRRHPPHRAWGHPGVPSGCAAGMSFLSWVKLTPFEYHIHSLAAPLSAPRIKQKALTQAKILPVKREHCQRLWTPVEILLLLLILCVRCLATLIISDSIRSQRENRKVNTVTMSPGELAKFWEIEALNSTEIPHCLSSWEMFWQTKSSSCWGVLIFSHYFWEKDTQYKMGYNREL